MEKISLLLVVNHVIVLFLLALHSIQSQILLLDF